MKKLTDKERLDWVSAASRSQLEEVLRTQEYLYANSGPKYTWGHAFRAAIDAAMRAEKAEKKGGRR